MVAPIARILAAARRLLALGMFALASCVLPLPPSAHAVQPGVSADLTWGVPLSIQRAEARQMRQAGVRWVRLTFNWDFAEPVPGQYSNRNLRMYDRAIRVARANHLGVLMLVSRSPSWASGSSNPQAPPVDPWRYAALMELLARRWGTSVAAYEIWNEEDQPRFWPTASGPDPAAYVPMLQASYLAIKVANPRALVVFGGVDNDYDYVERAYALGARGYFDVMADHPYSCANRPDAVWHAGGRIAPGSFLAYRELHNTMAANGDGHKAMWLTEFGWSTASGHCGVSRQQQARNLTRAYQLMSRTRYAQIGFWYDWRNNFPMHDANRYEAQFGLISSNWRRKPAFTAFVRFAK